MRDLREELSCISIRAGHPDAERARILAQRLTDAAYAIEAPWASPEDKAAAVALARRSAEVLAELGGDKGEREARLREVLLDLCKQSGRIARGWARSDHWQNKRDRAEVLGTSTDVVCNKFTSIVPELRLSKKQREAIRGLLVAIAENRGGRGKRARVPSIEASTEALCRAMGWKGKAASVARTRRRHRARIPPGQ
ncbi:MAG TPA: hypothetical protein VFR23_26125 [Jiangellaceae bacterium]|nr:hypothetical protein [Jiangellaceae bacterium]